MNTYIALLRGINVGGNNKIPMSELKLAFEKIGHTEVKTYINSGNIIFVSEETDTTKLIKEIEAIIKETFGFDIPTTVISADDLEDAMNHKPDWWNISKESSSNAIFVIPPITMEEVFESLGKIKPVYESVAYHGRVIFWTAARSTISRTMYAKMMNATCYKSLTIRNANTTCKLYEMTKKENN